MITIDLKVLRAMYAFCTTGYSAGSYQDTVELNYTPGIGLLYASTDKRILATYLDARDAKRAGNSPFKCTIPLIVAEALLALSLRCDVRVSGTEIEFIFVSARVFIPLVHKFAPWEVIKPIWAKHKETTAVSHAIFDPALFGMVADFSKALFGKAQSIQFTSTVDAWQDGYRPVIMRLDGAPEFWCIAMGSTGRTTNFVVPWLLKFDSPAVVEEPLEV